MKTIIPIGPYHPLQEEPAFFQLTIEGERVSDVDVEIGYNHRAIEKIAESKTYDQITFLIERICGICSTSHPIAYCKAVEDICRIEIPEKAKYIRSIIGELERIHSHLLHLGLAGHFIGYNTLWMWAWKYREPILDMFEIISGNRNHYALLTPGGVRRDIKNENIPLINKVLDGVEKKLNMLTGAVLDDPILLSRLKGVGILTKEEAINYSAVGPTARGSGYDIDVRKDEPYDGYGLVDWNIVIEKDGDILSKTVVRLRETVESIKIVRRCLERLKEVKDDIGVPIREVPPGEGIGRHEAPRGETFHYIRSDGANRPLRYKVRAPTYMNLPTCKASVPGIYLSDALITLASIDPCYSCTERMAIIENKKKRTITEKELLQLSYKKTEKIAQRMKTEPEKKIKKVLS